MTAEPTGHVMWSPDPVRQRLANYFIEDVLGLPDDAPRVELRDVGIPRYWRIEQGPLRIYAYEIVDGKYELAADSETELVLSAPFDIQLPIRDITP